MADRHKQLFINETVKDQMLSQLKYYYINGWPTRTKVKSNVSQFYKFRNEIFVEEDIVYFKNQIVVPDSLKKFVLNKVHEGHMGVSKTIAKAKTLFYWIGMSTDIKNFVSKCWLCEKYQNRKPKEPLILVPQPSLPFEKVATDILEYASTSYLVLIDYYSKWIELVKLKYKNSDEIISVLKTIFSIHGIPKVLIADNMPFNSEKLRNFANNWSFEIKTSSPYYPRSNGLAERAVGICKKMLKKCLDGKIDLNTCLLEYRSTPVMNSTYSPAELLFSRKLKTKLPIRNEQLKPKLVKNYKNVLVKKSEQNKKYYDKNVRPFNYQFKTGDNVVYRNNNVWLPAKVINQYETPRSIVIRDENNRIKRRNTIDLRTSQNEPVFRQVKEEPIENPVVHFENQKTDTQINVNGNSNVGPYITKYGREVKPTQRLNFHS